MKKQLVIRRLFSLCILAMFLLGVLSGCSSKKNTAFNRFYQGFTTRYNVYHNGINSYNDAYKQLIESYEESYSERILIDPTTVKAYETKANTGGPFDASIIKGRKAISLHSIRSKPERKPGWQKNPKLVAQQQQTEYNAFLHNAWMLVGQSQYHNGDFLEAMATFAYIARLYKTEPKVRDNARLWQVRCYVAMGWLSEGRKVLDLVPSSSAARENQKGIYNLMEAERLLAEGRSMEALPYLKAAAKSDPSRLQKARLHYLSGQILAEENHAEEARKAFNKTISLAPPFKLDLAARIRRAEIGGKGRKGLVIKELQRMGRKEKNIEVLDQIYLALGNVYMEQPDTTAAIKAYQFASDTSKLKQADYALANIRLGDIYMSRHDYIKAQPCFSNAITALAKSHADHKRVTKLSEDLDALVLHASVVHEQDSLQHLASLPEEERNRIIDSVILETKKEQKRLAREQELAKAKEQQEASNDEFGFQQPSSPATPPGQTQGNGEFYFYNPPLIAQGKAAFERKWGRRTLEDNWRRRSKDVQLPADDDSPPSDEPAETWDDEQGELPSADMEPDSLKADSIAKALEDPLNRAYYTSRLPMTPEAVASSDILIQDGLYGMGEVFNDQMELFDDAARVYQDLLDRFPNYNKKLDVLYKLYLLSERMGQKDKAAAYRQQILDAYPEEPLAIALRDPAYLEKLRNIDKEPARLYEEAFEAYLSGDEKTVVENYAIVRRDYPTSELLPKFAFLDALSYVLQGDGRGFRMALDTLVRNYPTGDISELSQLMLGELLRGRQIARGGFTGINWDVRLFSDSTISDSVPEFGKPLMADRWRLVLLYPTGSADRNAVVFAISAFNYSRFTRYTLDALPNRKGDWEEVTIKSLPRQIDAWFYIEQAYGRDGYMSRMGENAILFPVDESNAAILEKGRSVGEYINYLSETLPAPAAQVVINRWESIMEAQMKELNIQEGAAIGKPEDQDQKAPEEAPRERELPDTPIAREPIFASPTDSISVVEAPAADTIPPVAAAPADTIPQTSKTDSDISSPTPEDSLSVVVPTEEPAVKESPKAIYPEQITIKEVQTLSKDRKTQEAAEKRAAEKAKREKERERQAKLKAREKEKRDQLKAREKAAKEKAQEREKQAREKRIERERAAKVKAEERRRAAKEREAERKRIDRERGRK